MKLLTATILPLVIPISLAQPACAAEMTDRAMAAWIALSKPAQQHARLQEMAGRWNVRQRDWRGNGEPWNDTNGQAVWRPVLGGRFMQQELVTSLKGHPYRGLGLIGFDREAGKFVGAWMDDFGTSLLPLEGDWDENRHTLTLKGYIGAQADSRMQWVMKQILRDKNHMTVEWWGPTAAGTKAKVVEVDYTRVVA